jgi:hypothetical protein
MTAEQITTIISNLFTTGGVAILFYLIVRSLKQQIGGLNKTIEAQNQTLEVMEKRVIETEKLGNVYKNLVNDLPEFVDKYKKFINDSKDEVIAKLKQDQSTDENLKAARELELKRLEIHEKMVSDLPKLREELISAFEAIEERIDAMQPQLMPVYGSFGVSHLISPVLNLKTSFLDDDSLKLANTPLSALLSESLDANAEANKDKTPTDSSE